MKTSYPHRNSFSGRPKPSNGLFIACVIVFLIAWIFHSFFSSLIYRAATPVLSVKASALNSLSFYGAFIQSHAALARENAALEQQVSLDSINLSESQAIEMQDESLRQAIGDTSSTTEGGIAAADAVLADQGVVANVIEAPGVSPYDTLVIDSGADQGIEVGDTARVGTVTIIGLVTQVFPSSSIVTLLSSPNQQLAVTVASSTPATAYGMGGGNFIITLPQDAVGGIGDAVFVPQYSESIGRVQTVDQDDADASKNLYVAFPFPIETLRMVTVYPHH